MDEKIIKIEKSGRIKILDSVTFIKMLSLNEAELMELAKENKAIEILLNKYSQKELLQILTTYGRKQMNGTKDIPSQDVEYIIHTAIAKALTEYDSSKGTNFLSFYWEKLRGELTNYKIIKERQIKRIKKMINEEAETGISYKYQKDKTTDENYVEPVEFEDAEEKHLRRDLRKRQIAAFRMAFSNLPRLLQIILYEIAEGKTLETVANMLDLTKQEVTLYRNQALSLIFQKILRSQHLDKEEKEELIKVHELNLDIEKFENIGSDNKLKSDDVDEINYNDSVFIE